MRCAACLASGILVVLATTGRTTASPRCGTIEVVDRDGRPLAGAEVAYHSFDPRETSQRGPGRETWTTNAAGRVCDEAFLEPGFLEMHAPKRLGGWCVASEVVPYRGWRASAPVTRVTLPIKRVHRSRRGGRVVAPNGKPVARASILVVRIHPEGTQCSELGPDDWITVGRDGRFVLPPLPDGDIELTVDARDHAQKVFVVTLPTGSRDLAIEPGARWTGRVLDPDGAPIDRCLIELRTRDGLEVSSACSRDGAGGFDLRRVPPGALKVRIRIGAHPTLSNRTFVDEVVFVPNEERQGNIRLPAGLTLAGQVVTDSGAPAAYATVTAFSADRARSSWEGRLEVTADAGGRFELPHVAAGEWRVIADIVTAKPEDQRTVNAGATDVKLVSRVRRR